ncbi:hypothetical protein ACE3NQ_01145 [Paenibacillus terreus]|uniref:Uncharacterized protein n=2 Tax=Paenibacillus terreus TaxID=1387834 RepID=A0ABV5B1E4_9BACL
MTKVNQSLDQAERPTSLADQLCDHKRMEAIRNMNELEIEAFVLKEKIAYNENMLARQQTKRELYSSQRKKIFDSLSKQRASLNPCK